MGKLTTPGDKHDILFDLLAKIGAINLFGVFFRFILFY